MLQNGSNHLCTSIYHMLLLIRD